MTTKTIQQEAERRYPEPEWTNIQITLQRSAFIAGVEYGQQLDKWVSVCEMLPELNSKVIVARPNKYSGEIDILMAYLYDSGKDGRSYGKLGEEDWLYGYFWSLPAVVKFETITHWQPLPTAPPTI